MATPPSAIPIPPNIGQITSSQLIGTLLNFFLFGALFIQVYVYRLCFPKDRPAIKWLVYLVFLTMTVCTCLNAADAQYWFAAGYGDLAAFSKPRFSPFYTPLIGSVIALAVQLFFCYRISVFRASRGAVWWSAAIAVISLIQAAGGIGGGVKALVASNENHDQVRTVLVYLWLVGDAVADLMIAGTMTYLLSQASESQTRDIVRGVIRLIIETNTFSASVAIIGLVLFAGVPSTDYFICPTMVLPGIYANTLLVLLNNRASPSRTSMRPDYRTPTHTGAGDVVYSDDTMNGTGLGSMWKASPEGSMGGGGGVHLQPLDFTYPAKTKSPRDDGGVGTFVAAPNPVLGDEEEEIGYGRGRAGSGEAKAGRILGTGPPTRHLVSGWDDTSYRDAESSVYPVRSSSGDGYDASLMEVEHPYGSAGTYSTTPWRR